MKENKAQIKNGIEKIVVNVGIGRLTHEPQFEDKILPEITEEISRITGQRPSPRPAKKAISNFKTRKGDIIAIQVTLRGKRMVDFLQKTIHIVFPRVKDFRGIDPKNVDERGNLNVGFREQSVFPEISMEKSRVNYGIQMTIVTKEKNREKSLEFLRLIGVPIKK